MAIVTRLSVWHHMQLWKLSEKCHHVRSFLSDVLKAHFEPTLPDS